MANESGRNGRAKVGAKNERAKQELEVKFPPFFSFFFWFFLHVLSFLCSKKKR